ncbi:hypothetical protein [Flammeovirga sp. OC4]|uniref:hypothetical protein n=1 Tax=Flammeovirga sp. OC4 TaxID=1382345 RepID=UPI0005C44849|nr:hypothetical protein [Flammeovirga sp. OC4]
MAKAEKKIKERVQMLKSVKALTTLTYYGLITNEERLTISHRITNKFKEHVSPFRKQSALKEEQNGRE